MKLIRNVSGIVAGILLFAGFIHHTWPLKLLAVGGLTLSAVLIGYSSRNVKLVVAFGLVYRGRITLYWLIPGLLIGLGAGILTRTHFNLAPIPDTLTMLALVTPLIGAFEEVVFRGFLQGYLRPIGGLFSILYAMAAFTCYKILVVLSFSSTMEFDLFFLLIWTSVGGFLFGLLRELSRNVYPSLLAHALFDIILYGGMTLTPAWIWS